MRILFTLFVLAAFLWMIFATIRAAVEMWKRRKR